MSSPFPVMPVVNPLTLMESIGKDTHFDRWEYFPVLKRVGMIDLCRRAIAFPDGSYLAWTEYRRMSSGG